MVLRIMEARSERLARTVLWNLYCGVPSWSFFPGKRLD